MREKKKVHVKRIIGLFLVAILICSSLDLGTLNALAALSYGSDESAETLVSMILGDGITASGMTKTGTVYSFQGGSTDDVGMEGGIILDTSGKNDASAEKDPQLEALIESEEKAYGGHTSTLEFVMTAEGTLLNFNYAFASREFDQSSNYNDIFGLFVKVNDGDWENIALLDNGKHITITNLRAGQDGTQFNSGAGTSIVSGTDYDYFTAKSISMSETCNGITHLFNAQKEVSVGDTVTVKFAIADVGDTSYNSYVMIQAGSLSFNAPGSKPDYESERLTQLESGKTYEITVGEETYTFVADENGSIPLQGRDKDGKEYDFIGKTLSVVQKGEGQVEDSEPQEIYISQRPETPQDPAPLTNTPADIDAKDVTTTTDTITVNPVEGQEYTIDEGATWVKPDSEGKVVFQGLEAGTEYTIKTRVAATEEAPASYASTGVKVKTWMMFEDLTANGYTGVYDGKVHYATVSVNHVEGASVTYADTLNGTYQESLIGFSTLGEHEVYYCVAKEGYYSAYGKIMVDISPRKITVSASDAEKIYGEEDPDFEYRITEGTELEEEPLVDILLDRDDGEDVTTYSIKPSAVEGSNPNYDITFRPGSFTIRPASFTVEAKSYTGTYDGQSHGITTISSASGVDIYYSETALTADNYRTMGSTEKLTFTDACEKKIYYYAVLDNHNPVSGSADVSIAKKVVTVSPFGSQTIIAGQNITKDAVVYDGFLGDDNKDNGAVQTLAVLGTDTDLTKPGTGTLYVMDKGELKPEYAKNYELKASDETVKLIIVPKQTGDNGTSVKLPAGNSGIVETDTIKEEGLPKTQIDNLTVETAKGLLTQEEAEQVEEGQDALIYLELTDATKTATDAEKTTVTQKAKEAGTPAIGAWLDLSLYKKIGDALAQKITETGQTVIEVAVELPENLVQKDTRMIRTYRVIRYHEGIAEVIPTTCENGVLKFTTDKFSLYAIAYQDSKVPVKVTGVALDKGEATLVKEGDTLQLTATVTPADADNPEVTWTTSDSKVATVDANGKVTPVGNGTCIITVTTKEGGKTAACKVTVQIPEPQENGGTEISAETLEANELALNAGLKVSQTGSNINIQWGKVSGADGYNVYVQYCGKKFTDKSLNQVKSGKKTKITVKKVNGKKLNLKKNYKVYVTAYKLVDGNQITLGKTITAHIVGRNNTTYTNVKQVKVKKSSYTLKVGKTATIKASTVLVNKNRKQLSDGHAKEFRYASSNKAVATVSKKGKITAVGKGKCTIYVYARNGYAKKVKVTVK